MAFGYEGKLYILAFDHRGSFQKKMFGINGIPSPQEIETIVDAKQLIFEGMLTAVEGDSNNGSTNSSSEPRMDAASAGVLVDEQFGSDVPARAKKAGLTLAMPVEKSGQNMFDFEYGEQFGEHIEKFNPDFSKVLVRYNPEGDRTANQDQLKLLKRLADWLHSNNRKFLFELLVPAEPAQLSAVGDDTDRYDAELRPDLMRRAIAEIQDFGIEVDVWKIEGVDTREEAEMLSRQTRTGPGRERVACVILGRGASTEKVDHWLTQAAPVDGFIGFAIGRSIWWDALKGFLAGDLNREQATHQIAANYLRFFRVYHEAESVTRV